MRYALAVFALAALLSPLPAQKKDDAGEKEVFVYKLTMPRLRQYSQLLEKIGNASKSDPSLAKELEGKEQADQTLDQIVKYLETSAPRTMALAQASGFTAREFIVLPLCLLNAAVAASMQEQKRPDTNLASKENTDFVIKNRAELRKLHLLGEQQ
jgi:hypothetical protein